MPIERAEVEMGFLAQIEAHHGPQPAQGQKAAAQLGKVVEESQQGLATHRRTAITLRRRQDFDKSAAVKPRARGTGRPDAQPKIGTLQR